MVRNWQVWAVACILFLSAAIFIVDVLTPQGMEVWVLYLPFILAPVWISSARLVGIAYLGCSAMVVLGGFLSPTGANPPWWDLLNRGMGMMTIGLMAFACTLLCHKSGRLTDVMHRLQDEIAQHEAAEGALKISEERLRLAVLGAGMGTWDFDLRDGTSVWSETHFKMLGFEPRAEGGATMDMWVSRIVPQDRERVLQAREEAKRQQTLYFAEYRINRDGIGELAWLAVLGRYFYDASGQAVRFAGVSFDVTQHKAKELQGEMLNIFAREQVHIGQELHDGVGQELTGLGLMAQAMAERLPDGSPGKKSALRLVEGLGNVHQQVRNLARGLVPVEMEAKGLWAALDELAAKTREQSGIAVTLDYAENAVIPSHAAAFQLYRIAQEAVSNALRHASPRHIRLAVLSRPDTLCLRIADDGVGMPDPSMLSKALGIRIMEYRAGIIGGVLRIEPTEGGGTTVTCTLFKKGNHDQQNSHRR
jgi:signal transduction histidine kinase